MNANKANHAPIAAQENESCFHIESVALRRSGHFPGETTGLRVNKICTRCLHHVEQSAPASAASVVEPSQRLLQLENVSHLSIALKTPLRKLADIGPRARAMDVSFRSTNKRNFDNVESCVNKPTEERPLYKHTDCHKNTPDTDTDRNRFMCFCEMQRKEEFDRYARNSIDRQQIKETKLETSESDKKQQVRVKQLGTRGARPAAAPTAKVHFFGVPFGHVDTANRSFFAKPPILEFMILQAHNRGKFVADFIQFGYVIL
ncbi:hypothetical protein EVAR_45346_1 [Eumeta japonica]|uniref:Uncharacterized protein n=1 Tax=Eumeta variegata TaxID=151549 RepID=A0A4C1XVU2_EUMVA|nr:hypothetical protein EVAR_45346_1 [Eumeta japonica]